MLNVVREQNRISEVECKAGFVEDAVINATELERVRSTFRELFQDYYDFGSSAWYKYCDKADHNVWTTGFDDYGPITETRMFTEGNGIFYLGMRQNRINADTDGHSSQVNLSVNSVIYIPVENPDQFYYGIDLDIFDTVNISDGQNVAITEVVRREDHGQLHISVGIKERVLIDGKDKMIYTQIKFVVPNKESIDVLEGSPDDVQGTLIELENNSAEYLQGIAAKYQKSRLLQTNPTSAPPIVEPLVTQPEQSGTNFNLDPSQLLTQLEEEHRAALVETDRVIAVIRAQMPASNELTSVDNNDERGISDELRSIILQKLNQAFYAGRLYSPLMPVTSETGESIYEAKNRAGTSLRVAISSIEELAGTPPEVNMNNRQARVQARLNARLGVVNDDADPMYPILRRAIGDIPNFTDEVSTALVIRGPMEGISFSNKWFILERTLDPVSGRWRTIVSRIEVNEDPQRPLNETEYIAKIHELLAGYYVASGSPVDLSRIAIHTR